VSKDSGFMERNITWNVSLAVNWFPGNFIIGVVNKLLYSTDTEPPHVAHGSFLDISSTMNVHIIIYNETAMI